MKNETYKDLQKQYGLTRKQIREIIDNVYSLLRNGQHSDINSIIEEMRGVVSAVGGGGYWGIKFNILIPFLLREKALILKEFN
jgi:hypothetical protein